MRSSRSQLCERARQWASLRVDGELSELESALLDAHLGRCEACSAFTREAEGIAATLRSAALERPAPIVLDLPRRRRGRTPARVLQAAAAATLVLVAAGLGSALGVANRGPQSRAVVRHTAMVAMEDNANRLRQLRRPALVGPPRTIARNRLLPGEQV